MILILSTNREYSSDRVIDWLKQLNGNFVRLNDNDIVDPGSKSSFNITYSKEKKDIEIRNTIGKTINLEDIKVVWFRKFGFFSKALWYKQLNKDYNTDVTTGLRTEYFTLLNTFLKLVKDKKWLTPYWKVSLNKYKVMEMAQEVGLEIPSTYIINQKRKLEMVFQKHERIISKSIKEAFHVREKEGFGFFSMFTEEITAKDIANMPESFFPSYVLYGKPFC